MLADIRESLINFASSLLSFETPQFHPVVRQMYLTDFPNQIQYFSIKQFPRCIQDFLWTSSDNLLRFVFIVNKGGKTLVIWLR